MVIFNSKLFSLSLFPLIASFAACTQHNTTQQNKILILLMSKNKDSFLKMEISINISNISAIFASTFIKQIYTSKIGSQRGHLVAIKLVITLSKTLQKTTWPFLMQRRFFNLFFNKIKGPLSTQTEKPITFTCTLCTLYILYSTICVHK